MDAARGRAHAAAGVAWAPLLYLGVAATALTTLLQTIGQRSVSAAEASLIYALEPRETPASVLTPIDILKSTLGRPAAEAVVDPIGRKLRKIGRAHV